MSQAPAITTNKKVPHVRITAPSVDYAITSAGAQWAGVSELPKTEFTEVQLAALKLDKRLQVEEFDREPAVEPEAAAE